MSSVAQDPGAGENRRRPLAAETILHLSRAADLPGRDRIFVIGPFASRVSFFRQQNRALNLVWAMATGLQCHDKRVAVVGAGLAGATAALALQGLGCSVTLYDARGGLMAKQDTATHRIAHPTVNLWPDALPLEPTTNLPFLNWMSTSAATVAADLAPEWKRLSRDIYGPQPLEITRLKAYAEHVIVEAEGNSEEFDYVILATGFHEDDDGSYWSGPTVEPPRGDDPPVIVSGAGDGGLIETLRLCYEPTAFDSGRLIIKTAQRMQRGAVVATVREGERQILEEAEKRFTKGPGASQTDGAAAALRVRRLRRELANDEASVEKRQYLYLKALRSLPAGLRRDLDTWIIRRDQPSVHLVAPQAQPFLTDVAPIHKLLLAHLIDAGRVIHHRGRVRAEGIDPPLPFESEGMGLIHRYGATFDVRLLDRGEKEDLESRQGAHIDDFDVPCWHDDSFGHMKSKASKDRRAFLKDHLHRAQRLTDLFPEHVVNIHPDSDGFSYSWIGSENEPIECEPPDTLFGMPLKRVDWATGFVPT